MVGVVEESGGENGSRDCDGCWLALPCPGWDEPARTLLGARQERWLLDGIGRSPARWQVLAQQVMVAPFDAEPGPEARLSMDTWTGYPAARARLLGAVAERAPHSTVVLTGDIHSHWVNELHADLRPREGPGVAAEFVATSIS